MKNMHDVRREDAARQGRPVRRRLLRPAVAVLRHAGDQASGLAEPVRRRRAAMMDGGGCFRANFGVERDGVNLLAEDGSYPEGLRAHHRLSRVRPRADEEARLVGRADRRREEGGRRQELEDRPVGRHPARDDEARLPSVGQRQGARDRVEFPRRHSAAPRAAVFAAARPGRQVSDARRQEGVLAPADAVQDACSRRTSRTRSPRTSRWCSPAAAWSSTKAAARRRARNPWLAELQQENFVEINPKDANDRGVRTANTCG